MRRSDLVGGARQGRWRGVYGGVYGRGQASGCCTRWRSSGGSARANLPPGAGHKRCACHMSCLARCVRTPHACGEGMTGAWPGRTHGRAAAPPAAACACLPACTHVRVGCCSGCAAAYLCISAGADLASCRPCPAAERRAARTAALCSGQVACACAPNPPTALAPPRAPPPLQRKTDRQGGGGGCKGNASRSCALKQGSVRS